MDNLEVIAEQFERLSKLIRERPESVAEAMRRLEAKTPGVPDLVWLPSEQRQQAVQDIADGLGVSTTDLMLLYQAWIGQTE